MIDYIINKILQMDPQLCQIMRPLQHKIICIKCLQFPHTTLYVLFDSDNLSLLINRHDLKADTEISGDLVNFTKLLTNTEQVPLSSLNIKVYGDLAVAQNLEIFIKKLDIDWQEYLAQITNDQFSEATGRILKTSLQTLREQANSLMMVTSDYLNYESDLLAQKDLLDEFNTAVDNLRNAVDRFASRLDYYANN